MDGLYRHLGIALIPLLSLNYSYVFSYAGSSSEFSRQSANAQIIEPIESLSIDQIVTLPPWEREPETQNPYVLPPWGLTVNDFVVTRQMPLSSGQREVLLSSPSTGSEQRLLISLPNSPRFQIYEMTFKRVLVAGDGLTFNDPNTHSLLQNFQIKFNNNELTEVVLADGTTAEFIGQRTVIKSPSGQILENFQLSEHVSHLENEVVAISSEAKGIVDIEQDKSTHASTQPFRIAQSQSACEREVYSTASQISSSIAPWSSQMTQSSSDYAKTVGWALGHSSEALDNSVSLDDSVPNLACRPPVQCEEKHVSGGSEVRTDLFDVPQGVGGSEVTLQYEFYDIPDSVEMYYDGTRIFSVGPSSGSGSRTFNLPSSAQQVGITLRGNNDPNTEWWYTISCSDPCSDTYSASTGHSTIVTINMKGVTSNRKNTSEADSNTCSKPLLIFYGGGGDRDISGNVRNWVLPLINSYSSIEGLTIKYYPFTDNFIPIGGNAEVIQFINNHIRNYPNSPIILVGHSYGGDSAYEAIDNINKKVDLLVTLDPVSNFRTSQRAKPTNVLRWVNVWTSDSWSVGDVVAELGGDWDRQDNADQNIELQCVPHGKSQRMYIEVETQVLNTLRNRGISPTTGSSAVNNCTSGDNPDSSVLPR